MLNPYDDFLSYFALRISNEQQSVEVVIQYRKLNFGGDATLIASAGYDGLIEFEVEIDYKAVHAKPKDVIILACYSKEFFQDRIGSCTGKAFGLENALDGIRGLYFKSSN